MVITKLLFIEQDIINGINKNTGKLKAIKNIHNLLKKVDLESEIIPLQNAKKLGELLENLKGKPLSINEKSIIIKLIQYE